MAEVIRFPRLARGEIIELEINGERVKCKVIKHEGNNVYKLKALNGKHKGYFGHFKITEFGNIRL
jgi:hypothetical protein